MTVELDDHQRAALRERYRAERDKRLRGDGNNQYVEVTGVFGDYAEDPWANPQPREPRTDEVTFAFIGGGFAGLLAAARLVEAGVDDVCIIEKGGDVGGTWYWNRYPGAQCDTASMVYLPLLEETGHMPSEKYTHGPEIFEHTQRIARHYGLYDKALLSTEVTDVSWDQASQRWVISTNRGDRLRTKYVGMGTGPLHRPKLPGIPGINSFKGNSFHTSRWDYEYTGGDPKGATMEKLADKRVGIIGTGATAVQCVPHLARSSGELFVFQRTPSSIDTRNNHPIDADWFANLEPGWQAKWLLNFTTLQTGGFVDEDLVKDGWTDISQRIRDRIFSSPEPDFSIAGREKAYHESDDEKMTEIRARVDAIIEDPTTADALKPWYRQLCKRPCFHDQYLQSYNRPSVHLIDTDGKGVDRIDETGVWVGNQHYELDLLIYASGFEVGTTLARRTGFEVTGRDGVTLGEYWHDGMRSLHGLHTYGFPNFFFVSPAQGANLISNVPHNLVEAAKTIAMIVQHAESVGATEVEVDPVAEADWLKLLESGQRRFGNDPNCTPGYYNNEGQDVTSNNLAGSLGYPEGSVAYFAYIKNWRETGDFTGLHFR
jgi:cation diffusion facilitator CzcD-associated flavoprotein CzcO